VAPTTQEWASHAGLCHTFLVFLASSSAMLSASLHWTHGTTHAAIIISLTLCNFVEPHFVFVIFGLNKFVTELPARPVHYSPKIRNMVCCQKDETFLPQSLVLVSSIDLFFRTIASLECV